MQDDINNFISLNGSSLRKTDFENGSWAFNSKANNAKRLRIKEQIKVTRGDVIVYTNPTLKIYLGLLETLETNDYLQNSGWVLAGQTNAEYLMRYSGYLNIILEVSSGSSVSVDDYDCNIVIKSIEDSESKKSLPQDVKSAFLNLARSVPYLSETIGQSIYDSLFNSFYSKKYNWDLTTSLTDTISNRTATLGVRTDHTLPEMTENGVSFTDYGGYIDFGIIYDLSSNMTIEIDVAEFNIDPEQVPLTQNIRFVMMGDTPETANGILIWRKTNAIYTGWGMYYEEWPTTIYNENLTDRNVFENSTIRLTIDKQGITRLYVNGVYQGVTSIAIPFSPQHLYIGNGGTDHNGSCLYNVTIAGVRVYEEAIV